MRGLLWWLGAFVFAGLAGVLTYGLLSSQDPKSAEAQAGRGGTRPVVVAAIDIPFRRSISESEVVIKELPADSVPEGAATSIDQVVGKMSSIDVVTNQPLLVKNLVTPDVVTQQVALSVPKGKIVTVIPTGSQLISNRLVRPGDHIDLLATFSLEVARDTGSGPMDQTVGLLKNLEVHAIILPTIDKKGDSKSTEEATSEGGVFRTTDEKAQSILVAVDPQDAQVIRHVIDSKGHLDLALRAPGDNSQTDTTVVNDDYLRKRYNIEEAGGDVQLSPAFANP